MERSIYLLDWNLYKGVRFFFVISVMRELENSFINPSIKSSSEPLLKNSRSGKSTNNPSFLPNILPKISRNLAKKSAAPKYHVSLFYAPNLHFNLSIGIEKKQSKLSINRVEDLISRS